ncbi:MAG: N-6 DNA methylase [Pseudomonadota bacterium]
MMNTIANIAETLWAPATHLHTEGLSYHAYLTELTWLLLLKIAPAIGSVPVHLSWESLIHKQGKEQYEYYQKVIKEMRKSVAPLLAGIYAHARSSFKNPEQLAQVITTVDSVPTENLGEIYETLLEMCADENENSLHIAPRSLVDLMVILIQPQPGELIQDPLAGTASFVVAADEYIKVMSDELSNVKIKKRQNFIAIEPDLARQRLALMNCLLHDIDRSQDVPVRWGDSLLSNLAEWPTADVILSMLVFASDPTDELGKHDTALALLQHIYQILKPGGRAAVVLPDKVLKAAGPAQEVRSTLLDTCVVHTVLRLPHGIFYPHKMSTQILFFRKGKTASEKTQSVWFYDLRTHAPIFGQYLHLTRKDLMSFEKAYGDDPLGQRPRREDEDWRCFSRETLAEQGDRLDGLQDEDMITEEIWDVLDDTMADLEALTDILGK